MRGNARTVIALLFFLFLRGAFASGAENPFTYFNENGAHKIIKNRRYPNLIVVDGHKYARGLDGKFRRFKYERNEEGTTSRPYFIQREDDTPGWKKGAGTSQQNLKTWKQLQSAFEAADQQSPEDRSFYAYFNPQNRALVERFNAWMREQDPEDATQRDDASPPRLPGAHDSVSGGRSAQPVGASALTDAQFGNQIKSGVVVVDFWAPWCGPCRAVGPVIDRVAQRYRGKAAVFKMNVDNNPVTQARFGINSIPRILIFKDGQLIKSLAGAHSEQTYANEINQALNR